LLTIQTSIEYFTMSHPYPTQPPADPTSGPGSFTTRFRSKGITVLMADDDDDDCMLAKEAWKELNTPNHLRFVRDGEELMEYLQHRGAYSDPKESPPPGLILLDLNMPKKNGYEALREIKTDPYLRKIPVIVFTTSTNEEDISQVYDLGANSFVGKPSNYDGYVTLLGTLNTFWLQLVKLPHL